MRQPASAGNATYPFTTGIIIEMFNVGETEGQKRTCLHLISSDS